MSEVLFIPGSGFAGDEEATQKVVKALNRSGLAQFSSQRVLVKLHMGERGNKFYLKPPVIKVFLDILKAVGAKPYLFDTVVKYPGSRDTKERYLATAKRHGFDRLGCPIIIGNEGNAIKVDINGTTYAFEVAKELCEAEYVLSVAHGKGHMMTGFGGSIKAFGMGGVSKESKGFIHEAAAPVVDGKKCELCFACLETCPEAAISKSEGRIEIDYTKCEGCEKCVRTCPSGAMEWKEEEFDIMLAAAARACLDESSPQNPKNKPKKKIYVNVLTDISKRCDCAINAGPVIAPDIGVVVSTDPVAVDAASIDLIEKASGKSLESIQQADPRLHVKYASELGMGSMKYSLVEV